MPVSAKTMSTVQKGILIDVNIYSKNLPMWS